MFKFLFLQATISRVPTTRRPEWKRQRRVAWRWSGGTRTSPRPTIWCSCRRVQTTVIKMGPSAPWGHTGGSAYQTQGIPTYFVTFSDTYCVPSQFECLRLNSSMKLKLLGPLTPGAAPRCAAVAATRRWRPKSRSGASASSTGAAT